MYCNDCTLDMLYLMFHFDVEFFMFLVDFYQYIIIISITSLIIEVALTGIILCWTKVTWHTKHPFVYEYAQHAISYCVSQSVLLNMYFMDFCSFMF